MKKTGFQSGKDFIVTNLENERQKKGETAVVEEPVDVDGVARDGSLATEQGQLLDDRRVGNLGPVRRLVQLRSLGLPDLLQEFRSRLQVSSDGGGGGGPGEAAVHRRGRAEVRAQSSRPAAKWSTITHFTYTMYNFQSKMTQVYCDIKHRQYKNLKQSSGGYT